MLDIWGRSQSLVPRYNDRFRYTRVLFIVIAFLGPFSEFGVAHGSSWTRGWIFHAVPRKVSLADLAVPIGRPGFDEEYPIILHWECELCLAINTLAYRSCHFTACSRPRTPGARVTDSHGRSVGRDHAMVMALWRPTTLPYGVRDVNFRRP